MMTKDIGYCIGIHINDPKTFRNFSLVSIRYSNACHELQKYKKKQFKKFEFMSLLTNDTNDLTEVVGAFILPNGSYYPKKFVIITKSGWVITTKTFICDWFNDELREQCRYKDMNVCTEIINRIQRQNK